MSLLFLCITKEFNFDETSSLCKKEYSLNFEPDYLMKKWTTKGLLHKKTEI
jgi:hypothetical protein